jgi:hypothetical protein
MRIVTAVVLALSLSSLAACSHPWKEYTYPAWGFAVSFQSAPEVVDTPASVKDGTAHTFKVRAIQGGRDLVVEVTDAAKSDKTPDQMLTEIPQQFISDSNGTVSGHADVTSGKVAGKDVTIDRGNDPTERMRLFVANHKVYQIITQSSEGAADPIVTKFLDSFRLL